MYVKLSNEVRSSSVPDNHRSFLMHPLAYESSDTMLAERAAPCLSLSKQAHRRHPENVQGPARFRNLVKQLAESLRADCSARAPAVLQPFEALAEDRDFWNNTGGALAVRGAPDSFRTYRLQGSVAEVTIAAATPSPVPCRQCQSVVDG